MKVRYFTRAPGQPTQVTTIECNSRDEANVIAELMATDPTTSKVCVYSKTSKPVRRIKGKAYENHR